MLAGLFCLKINGVWCLPISTCRLMLPFLQAGIMVQICFLRVDIFKPEAMAPRMKVTKLFKAFFQSERSSGYVLIGTTIFSLLLANLIIGPAFTEFFHHKVGFENNFLKLNL